MTALAPRRRPIFSRRTPSGPSLQLAGLAAAIAAIAGVSFLAGMNYGAANHADSSPTAVYASVAK